MGENTEQLRAENGAAWRRWLTGLIVLVVVCGAAYFLLGGAEGVQAKLDKLTGRGADGTAAPTDVVRSPRVVCDETLSIPAAGHQGRGFSLPSDRPVKVEVAGVRDTAKGFTVVCIHPDDWDAWASGKTVSVKRAFNGKKVSGMSETHRLPAGQYMLVVSNTENLFNSMEVHLRVTVDPN